MLAACSPSGVLNALAPRQGVARQLGLAYGAGPRRMLDVYAPEGARGVPLVVFLYGGSWQGGERGMYRWLGASLAGAGLACVVPDYRVWPEVGFPALLEDPAAAVAWARENAARFGAAPGRLVLAGHSAGAHLAVMLALQGRARPRGVVGLAGPYDFLPLSDPALRAIFGPEADWPASQPVNFVHPGAPPMLLAAGTKDTTVLPRNTTRLAARLRAAGGAVEERLYPGLGHATLLGAMAGPLEFLAPVRRDVLAFVERVA